MKVIGMLAAFIGIVLVIGCAPAPSGEANFSLPAADYESPAQSVQTFGIAVNELEIERDQIISDFQFLAANMMDMRTLEVFDLTEDLALRQRDLQSRMNLVSAPSDEIAAVHAIFAIAYATELKGYQGLDESTRSGDLDGMQASMSHLFRADEFYRQAYDELDELLYDAGLSMADIRSN